MGAADTKPSHAAHARHTNHRPTSTQHPVHGLWFSLLWTSCHHDVVWLLSAVRGCSWIGFMFHVVRFGFGFLWFWHLDGLWSLHTGLSLRAPTGVVCVFFPHACHVFLPVGLPAGLLCFLLCLLVVFLLWLFCWLCRVFVGVFCWLLSCLLGVVCLLFVCWFAGLCLFSAVLQGFWLFGLSCLLCGVRVSEGAEM